MHAAPGLVIKRASGEVAEWLKASVSKTGVLARVSRVRIPPSPPLQNRTANAAGRRFHARGGGEGSEQVSLRPHDADLAVGDLDALGEGAQVIAAIAAAIDPHPLASGAGEFPEHLAKFGHCRAQFGGCRADFPQRPQLADGVGEQPAGV